MAIVRTTRRQGAVVAAAGVLGNTGSSAFTLIGSAGTNTLRAHPPAGAFAVDATGGVGDAAAPTLALVVWTGRTGAGLADIAAAIGI